MEVINFVVDIETMINLRSLTECGVTLRLTSQ